MASREFDLASSVTDAQSKGIGFNAYSVQVDNNSNQWLFLPDVGIYVSPYTIQAVFKLGGTSTAAFRFQAKPGTQQAAVIAGEYAVVTYFDYDQPASAGQTTVVRAPSTEWRNPKGLVFLAAQSFAGPVAISSDWSYTVPAGRRARVDSAQLYTELTASDGSGAGTRVVANISYYPLGGVGTDLIRAEIFTGTAVGARADVALAAGKDLQATDIIQGQSGNLRGAGVTGRFLETAIITEGDA